MTVSTNAMHAASQRARELVEQRGGQWQLTVLRDGQVLFDDSSEDGADGLFWSWSVSKAFCSVLTWQLIEDGVLSIDDRIVDYWPKFVDGDERKSEVTIRHVLSHRSGLPSGVGGFVPDALSMHDWQSSTRRLELARLRHPVGERAAYQTLSYGFLLGEVMRRATGLQLRELYRQRIFEPLGLRNTHLGLRRWQQHRAVPMQIGKGIGRIPQSVVNSRRTREAVIPAAGISTTSSDLARFFEALADDWADGVKPKLLRSGTLRCATKPTNDVDTPDATTHMYTRWSQGFQLGGEPLGHPTRQPFGAQSSPLAFGHNGSNAAVGFHDPANGLVLGFVSNVMRNPISDGDMVRDLADVFHEAVAD